MCGFGLPAQPYDRSRQAATQQGNVEAVFPRYDVNLLFVRRQQIEQQSCQPRSAKKSSHSRCGAGRARG